MHQQDEICMSYQNESKSCTNIKYKKTGDSIEKEFFKIQPLSGSGRVKGVKIEKIPTGL